MEVVVTDGSRAQAQAQQLVVAELGRVKELLRQLELHLHEPDLCRGLAAQIVALTDRSIGIARSSFPSAAAAHFADTPPPALVSGTPSPLSDASVDHHPFTTTPNPNPKKRKATARWRSQVRVSAAAEEDGHSWRKYGQKDILGAKHPRGYYRCTHRNTQGCAATKQVQRTDHDSSLFDVVYHGHHTCNRPSSSAAIKKPHAAAQSLLQSLAAGLTVDTENATDCAMTQPPVAAVASVSPSLTTSPVASGYGDWWCCDGGELQEVVSALAAVTAVADVPEPAIDADFMNLNYYFEFDPSFGALDSATLFQ
uniref:WRKY domain-containing protein n=1 Tax=Leersia perrieri TaxID=77586 RepID=A0A0D9X7G8_9ORYZ